MVRSEILISGWEDLFACDVGGDVLDPLKKIIPIPLRTEAAFLVFKLNGKARLSGFP